MKKFYCLLIFVGLSVKTVIAQHDSTLLEKNQAFKGAVPSKKTYYAIFQLDNNDPKIITKTIRNINNALADPRLAGKLQLELIAFSGGTDAFLKTSEYQDAMKALALKGVILAQCNNTLKERKIGRDELYDFIAIVPSGTGEIIIRETDGWSVIKP